MRTRIPQEIRNILSTCARSAGAVDLYPITACVIFTIDWIAANPEARKHFRQHYGDMALNELERKL